MKTIFLITGILSFSVMAEAQVALLDKIYDFVQQKEFGKAEKAIILVEKNATTANDVRTYYLKSFIYKELFLGEKAKAARDYLRDISLSSLKRCKDLDHNGKFKPQVKHLEDFILTSIYNDATENFNNEMFKESLYYFQTYLSLAESSQKWLDANYFVGTAFYNLEKLDSAEIFLETVKKKNYDEPALYLDLAYVYLKKTNKKCATKTVAEGLLRYADNFDLQIAELNILSQFQVYDTLEQKAEKFLISHPDNIEVILLMAATYGKLKNEQTHVKYFVKSELAYRKVLKMDSSHYEANYNLGVLYYNEAVDLVNTSSVETSVDELGKLLEKSSRLFEQALPCLLTIKDDNHPNVKLLQALQAIYYNLNMKTQLLSINEKLKLLNQ